MKSLNLDEFEQDILDSDEKKKAVSIRLSENDLYELKRKSLENGVPYQNIIQMLVHQYTSNKIHLDVS